MKSNNIPVLSLIVVLLALFSIPPSFAEGRIYKLGIVPQFDARQIQAIWEPIVMEISRQANIRIEFIGSASINVFEKQFSAGEFDFAYMNPYHLIMANKKQGYLPIVRDIGTMLSGIIVVRKDSKINKIDDLNGNEVAFPSPNALGAALIPRTEFGEIYHINIVPKYVQSHDSVYLNVALGQTVAGGGVLATLNNQPEKIRGVLKIIYSTHEVAAHPFSVHPRVSTDVQKKVLSAMLSLGQSEIGRTLLSKVPITKIGPSNMEDYEPLRKLGLENYYIQ